MRATYHVRYRMTQFDFEKGIDVIASNTYEAYDKATYEMIPDIEGMIPYSSWVSSVTYKNGNCKYFNTSEGNAF